MKQGLVLKHSIKVLLKRQLESCEFKFSLKNLEYHMVLLPFTMIIRVQWLYLTIRVCLARTKDMEIDLFFVREEVPSKCLFVPHVSAQVKWVDALTKPFSPTHFMFIRDKHNVVALFANHRQPCVWWERGVVAFS